ncbi:MAG: hypothetical protein ACI4S2_10760 [Lachnospiraceae bacterium]
MSEEFVQEEKSADVSKAAETEKQNTENTVLQKEASEREAEPAKEEAFRESEPTKRVESEEDSLRPKNSRLKSVMEYFQFGPDEDFTRDDYILARVRDEDLMEYLRMEQERERERRAAKEIRERRIFRTLQLMAILIAVAVIVGFLKDSPMVLVNILYIFGILLAVWIWKNPKDSQK